jgi:hypothetical protein
MVETSGKANGGAAGEQQHDTQHQEPTPVGRHLLSDLGKGGFDVSA